MKLAYFSVTSNEVPNLSEACLLFKAQGNPLSIYARTRTQLEGHPDRQARFIDAALDADAVVITIMAGKQSCPAWDALIDALEEKRKTRSHCPYFHIQPTGSNPDSHQLVQDLSDGLSQGQWKSLSEYYRFGGVVNLYNMLLYLNNIIHETNHPLLPPVRQPNEGLYHPDHGHIVDTESWYNNFDPQKPVVGIWFYQNFWTSNNKDHIDALVREVERQGAHVICVFHTRFKDKLTGNNGADYVVDKFFMNNGSPRIDVLINPVMFSLKTASPDYKDLLKTLNVPVIQAMTTAQSIEDWEKSDQGLSTVDITIGVAQPELDGVIIGVPFAAKQWVATDPLTGAAVNKYLPIQERIGRLVRLSLNWAALKRTPNREKKVAIIFHHYPPRNDRIGCASGLDSFASVCEILKAMDQEGYHIDTLYKESSELSRIILDGMTCDRRWLLPEQMAEKTKAKADREDFMPWHRALPEKIQKKMTQDWQAMPGDLFVHGDQLFFPGIINGNVCITIQPPRGYFEQIDKLYHDMHLSPPHHYLAQYRWISEKFGAHAVIHVGKHGSLEWLPGKAVGLSRHCYPDIAIGDLPNLYPYIINDPGEGTQAKRRSAACIIDHLPPAQTTAGLYDELAKLDNFMDEYRDAKIQDPSKLPMLLEMIVKEAGAQGILDELNLNLEQALSEGPSFLEQLHHFLEEIRDTAIADGLHIMGQAPEGERLVSTLAQLTRLANGSVPSLRKSVMKVMGGNTQEDVLSKFQKQAQDLCEALLDELLMSDMSLKAITSVQMKHLGKSHADVTQALAYVAKDLLPRLQQTKNEIQAVLDGLSGRFVPEGPSGAPTRGQADILPTGRNFFSVDPQKIPTPAAWKVGKRMADALIDRYQREHGSYPEKVGIVLWASPTMRSKGDDVSQILYLMGVKPVWQKGSGKVRGIEIIPMEKLGRPRIDVSPRVSGIFRDAFPLLMDLIDDAVQMTAMINEPDESNFIRRHVFKDVKEYEKDGQDQKSAFRKATFRIFGSPPGSYGSGVSKMVESKTWETTDDLGNMFIQWSSYAYGKNTFGTPAETQFRKSLARMSVTVKNEDTREKDMMSCTDFYSYHGGLITAVHAVQGKRPFSVTGDSSDPEQVVVRTTNEEARHIFRARLLNPVWLEGLKRHGFKGAGDISKAMDIIFGWDATADVIDDHLYTQFARKVALDNKMQEWMKSVNPHALENILAKLLEAVSRGMWQAGKELEDELKQEYLDIEGTIEELTEQAE